MHYNVCLLIVFDYCGLPSTTLLPVIIVDSCLCACSTVCREYLNHALQCFERQQLLDTGAFDFEFLSCFRSGCFEFGL